MTQNTPISLHEETMAETMALASFYCNRALFIETENCTPNDLLVMAELRQLSPLFYRYLTVTKQHEEDLNWKYIAAKLAASHEEIARNAPSF